MGMVCLLPMNARENNAFHMTVTKSGATTIMHISNAKQKARDKNDTK